MASITNGETTTYAVGTNSISSDVSNLPAGATVSVQKGSVDLTTVPEGVVVENKGDGSISVNGTPVNKDES